MLRPRASADPAQSRWTGGKDLSWEPVRIELVAEVAYEHLQGDRFRHTARFALAPDREPPSCTYATRFAGPMELRESSVSGD
jgi:ATP-dependent DNA ligase